MQKSTGRLSMRKEELWWVTWTGTMCCLAAKIYATWHCGKAETTTLIRMIERSSFELNHYFNVATPVYKSISEDPDCLLQHLDLRARQAHPAEAIDHQYRHSAVLSSQFCSYPSHANLPAGLRHVPAPPVDVDTAPAIAPILLRP
jgi:hypothetical protein